MNPISVAGQLSKPYYNKNVNNNLIHDYLRSLDVMKIKGEINDNAKDTFDLAINQVKNHLNDPVKRSLSIYLDFSPFVSKGEKSR